MNDPVLVAIDGGGSKTDAVALDLDGNVIARSRRGASSPQNIGLAPAAALVDSLVTEVLAGRPLLRAAIYLSGVDLPAEITAFRTAIAEFAWANSGEREPIVDNDMFALLRAGTEEPNAIAVVCGTGINCVGIRADGAHARFAALGTLSGDWGGGWQLGEQALWHAARAVDGRGEATEFTTTIPQQLGLPDIEAVLEEIHFGRLSTAVFATLAPLVLAAADRGDTAGLLLLERQAEEIVAIAVAAIRRLGLENTALPVVLGGGVLATGHEKLIDDVTALLAERAPLATIELVRSRPIIGAALLGLESVGANADALERARQQLGRE
ncbi:N-acetylglucosamine kinase [Parafrigoribacterium soli]|uniref:N-acetylglucosamine kinase n=1 Tax=Parafrigoribacterium soli TaxID=3144663 RepID=UPI0032ED48E5